jgi:hypothetical protein
MKHSIQDKQWTGLLLLLLLSLTLTVVGPQRTSQHHQTHFRVLNSTFLRYAGMAGTAITGLCAGRVCLWIWHAAVT